MTYLMSWHINAHVLHEVALLVSCGIHASFLA